MNSHSSLLKDHSSPPSISNSNQSNIKTNVQSRYIQVKYHEQQKERDRAQKHKEHLENQQRRKHSLEIKQQIAHKKEELTKLENTRPMALASEAAVVKMEQDRSTHRQRQATTKHNQDIARKRYNQAQLRQKTIDEEKNLKQTQAQFLRKVHSQTAGKRR